MSVQTPASDRRLPGGTFLWVIGAITVGFCIALALDANPWLRGPSGPFEWRWKYRPSLVPVRLILVGATFSLLGLWYFLTRKIQRTRFLTLALLIPIGLAITLTLHSTHMHGLQVVSRILNPAYYGYYPPATQVDDIGEFLDTYADKQATFDHPRLQTHPPGNVILHRAILGTTNLFTFLPDLLEPVITPRIAELPDWIDDYTMQEIVGGMVASLTLPVLAALAVIPMFVLLRHTLDEQAARRGAVLYLLMPALTLFAPKIDTIYTLLCTTVFLLVYLAARDGRWWLLYFGGFLCSMGMFMSYSMAPLSLAAGIFTFATGITAWRRDEMSIVQLGRNLLVLLAGGLSVQIISAVFFGYEPVRAYVVMRARTATYNTVRNYGYSLIYTPYDLLLFGGIPASVLGVYYLVRMIRARQAPTLLQWIIIASIISMMLTILSGVQKAENARVFLYIMPITICAAAAEIYERRLSERTFSIIAGFAVVQLIVFQIFLEVFL